MKNDLLKLLGETQDVKNFINYVYTLQTAKKREGSLKNPWAAKVSPEKFANYFTTVANEGLVLDGKNITIDTRGLSFNWVAYKNKMLLAYPESIIDMQLVYSGDEFSFSKESGKVVYSHKIADPFDSKDGDLVGAYCVIKNKRGEFLTILSKKDIEKHREIAKTQSIWIKWYKEMAQKTIIKKACSQHFRDIFQEIENQDNVQYDLEKATTAADTGLSHTS